MNTEAPGSRKLRFPPPTTFALLAFGGGGVGTEAVPIPFRFFWYKIYKNKIIKRKKKNFVKGGGYRVEKWLNGTRMFGWQDACANGISSTTSKREHIGSVRACRRPVTLQRTTGAWPLGPALLLWPPPPLLPRSFLFFKFKERNEKLKGINPGRKQTGSINEKWIHNNCSWAQVCPLKKEFFFPFQDLLIP